MRRIRVGIFCDGRQKFGLFPILSGLQTEGAGAIITNCRLVWATLGRAGGKIQIYASDDFYILGKKLGHAKPGQYIELLQPIYEPSCVVHMQRNLSNSYEMISIGEG